MWTALELDPIPGRVLAVSAPDARQMIVAWADDGLYGVWFGRSATSATTLRLGNTDAAERAFDASKGVLVWQGAAFPMHGVCEASGTCHGGTLPLTAPQGDRLAFDAGGRLVGVDTAEGERFSVPDPPRAGKWSAVGFSPDGRFLMVTDEWGVRLFRYAPAKGKPLRARPLEQEALLRAVSAEPDDDNPRLAYADWLADHDQAERGEFIRLQCEHARCVRAGKLFAQAEREQELLSQHGDLWQAEYPVIPGVTWSGFWRGFPGVTVLNAGTLVRNANKIWGAAPVESVVLLRLDQKNAAALAASAYLNRVRVLELRSYRHTRRDGGAERLAALLASAHLTGLWWLAVLGNSQLGHEETELLANSEPLRNLEILTLRWCELGDDEARALIASPHLNNLRELDLTGNEFTGDVPSDLRKRFPGVRF